VELQEGSKTELYQIMVARYYSAALGRFLRVDPGFDADLTIPQSWNMYAYVRNNPLVGIDPYGEDTYYVNRKLNSPQGPPVSKYNFLSHTLGVTTGPPTAEHPNGVVEHTSSWNAGETTLDDPADMDVAQRALDEGKARFVAGEDLDPLVEDQMRATQDPDHPSHHPWGIWRTCKGEARRLVRDAKREQRKTESPESSDREQKRDWQGRLNLDASTDVAIPGQRKALIIDGVESWYSTY
jgi:RHS repeat-associated protein